MNKKILIIGGIIIIVLIIFSFLRPSEKVASNNNENQKNEIIEVESADKIEVVHFHGTNQCFSCIKVGEYALKTIQEKFKDEYKNGMIVFMDINGELEENKEIVEKYNARGSSLYVNAITDNIDHIKEDITVWRLIYDKNYYMQYFEKELNSLLGK